MSFYIRLIFLSLFSVTLCIADECKNDMYMCVFNAYQATNKPNTADHTLYSYILTDFALRSPSTVHLNFSHKLLIQNINTVFSAHTTSLPSYTKHHISNDVFISHYILYKEIIWLSEHQKFKEANIKISQLTIQPYSLLAQSNVILSLALTLNDNALQTFFKATEVITHDTISDKLFALSAMRGGYDSGKIIAATDNLKYTETLLTIEQLLTATPNYFANADTEKEKISQDLVYGLLSLYSPAFDNELNTIRALPIIIDQILAHILLGAERHAHVHLKFQANIHFHYALQHLKTSELLSPEERDILYLYFLDTLSTID